MLFAAVKVARFAGVDPEVAIGNTCEKFIRRFRAVEDAVRARGAVFGDEGGKAAVGAAHGDFAQIAGAAKLCDADIAEGAYYRHLVMEQSSRKVPDISVPICVMFLSM